MATPTLYLIDAHAYLHRAYHAIPPLTTSKGEPVNAVYGFLRMILKILKQYKPDYVAVCFDTAAPTFRHTAYAEYKATRKEVDSALISQFPTALEATRALSLTVFELDGFEADDVIAHLTREGRKQNWDVVIVSGDKDAVQLVDDHVRVLNEPKDLLIDTDKVIERYGVAPKLVPDIFALMGDSSDNVPGVAGIGEKTAIKLIKEYGGLEPLLAAAPNIPGKVGTLLQTHVDIARQSRALVVLDRELPLTIDWEQCKARAPQPEALTAFLQRMEFYALLRELVPHSVASVDTSKREYSTITTEEALQAWLAEASNSERLAIDVETSGLDPLNCRLVGISMAYRAGTACYIPLGHHNLGERAQLSVETVRNYLAPILDGDHPHVYGHNLKFDAAVLKRFGFPIRTLYLDTMVMSYVLNPSRNGHGLKDLSLEFLHEPMTSIDQLIGRGAKQISMEDVAIDHASPYACADADMTLRLAELFEPDVQAKDLHSLLHKIEMPLVQVLGDMEEVGIGVDRSYLNTLGAQFLARTKTLETEIFALAGESFNINSPKQLAVILFEKLKLPIIRRTKTGISTDEEVLQKLSASHPLPKALMDYRELQKLQSTYVEGLQKSLVGDQSRIRTSFNQTVAATGRLSSSSPNLQNIPIRTELGRQIRRAFVARPEHALLSADYSQIDLRMLAHISGDDTLRKAFRNGEDVHTTTACEIFKLEPADVTPDIRRIAKSINFGIVYGMSAYGLSQQLQIPVDEAKTYIDSYFDHYPGVRAWIDATIKDAREKGYVRTLLGRIRYLPEIASKNSAMRGFAERTAMNTPIQGTSADVIKLAMIQLAQDRSKWSGHMLVQVHDELLFEIPDDDPLSSAPVIRHTMEHAIELSIPMVVDLKRGPNWADMKKL